MLPCVLLCLVMGSFAETVVQPPIERSGFPGSYVPDIFYPQNDPLIPGFDPKKHDLLKLLVPVSRPQITKVSKTGPPYYMTLDGSASTGYTYKWKQIRGDNEGFTSNKKTFTYKASVSGFYMWELTVCAFVYRCDTARVRYRLRNDRPMAIANMYWLGSSIYLDASKSTDDHNALVKYEWHQKKGDQPGFRSDKKSFVYKTNYKGPFKWRLRVCDAEGRCDGTVIWKDFSTPGSPPSVKAVIDGRWYKLPFVYEGEWYHFMDLTGSRSSGKIAQYVWIMDWGDVSGVLRYGSRMVYVSLTGGLYVWKLLVIGVDNTHHYTRVAHMFGYYPLIYPVNYGAEGIHSKQHLKAIPKLTPGIDNITLDATSSEGEIYKVKWEETSGDHVGDTFSEPHFSIPYPRSGECTYRLTVFDKNAEMSEDEVSLPGGGLGNWRDLMGVDGADIVEEPDTPPEKLAEMWSDFGNATDVGNPPSDNPPE